MSTEPDPVPGIPARPTVDYLEFKRAFYDTMPRLAIGDRVFRITPLQVMSDDQAVAASALMEKMNSGDESPDDAIAFARMILEDYDDFVALGGSAMGLIAWMDRYEAVDVDGQGVAEGEGGASSAS